MPEEHTETMPQVPLTLEGSSVLHQMFRFRRDVWREDGSHSAIREATAAFESMPNTALYAVLGHKADLMVLHFRNSFEELCEAQLRTGALHLSDFLEPTASYLSVVELGLYESTAKTYRSLMDRGVEPFSEQWNTGIEEVLQRQREAMATRLYPNIPDSRYACFYPMDRRRGEQKNWYQLPMDDRQRLMHEHGLVGRRYAGAVRQIISGSIGFDDWEWGVDLFADEPLVFKKLIYEMRFDEVSAVYAGFGAFYVGLRFAPSELANFVAGRKPEWKASTPSASKSPTRAR